MTLRRKSGRKAKSEFFNALKRALPRDLSDDVYSPFVYVESPDALNALKARLAKGDVREMAMDFKIASISTPYG